MFGVVITAFTLAAMQLDLYLESKDRGMATTTSFLTLALAQLWYAFNMTEQGERVHDSSVVRNRYVWAAVAFCSILLAAAVTFAPAARMLRVTVPDGLSLVIAVGMSLAAFLTGAVALALSRR
jgi:Ca2+-transporting ATPase